MSPKPFTVFSARWLAPDVKQFWIFAPRVAQKQKAGQFVIVRLHEHGERIPLTIADARPADGAISLVVQGVGKTTKLMNSLQAGDAILDLAGPLGNPSKIDKYGTVVVVGGGVGTAIALPVAKALKSAGNRVVSIIGARNQNFVILEEEIRGGSDMTVVMTEDGSSGQQGLVTDALRKRIQTEKVDAVFAIGPIRMMQAVAETTRADRIPTTVSLNPIMIDGTGMCGGCRVLVGNQPKFACVDGPEFDAHEVNFDVLSQRNAMYHGQERAALDRFEEHPAADLSRVRDVCRLAQLVDSSHDVPVSSLQRTNADR